MGKAWKRLVHRRRTWGATPEAPPAKIEAVVAAPTAVTEEEVIAPQAAIEPTAPKTTVKTAVVPRTKRIKRKTLSTKKK